MAVLLEPSEHAQTILSIFLDHFNSRPGSSRRITAIQTHWRGRNEDLRAGVDYALEQGWLEHAQAGAALRITETGFAAAGGILPTPEDSARQILSICVHQFRTGPNGLVMLKNLNLIWMKNPRFTSADFESGLDFAGEKGWLEDAGNGMSLRLTEAGYSEA